MRGAGEGTRLSGRCFFLFAAGTGGYTQREPVKPQERDELAQHRKLEAIQAELTQHRKMLHRTLLLVVLLSAVVLASLLYLLLGHH